MKIFKQALLALATFVVLSLVCELGTRVIVSSHLTYDIEMHKYATRLKRKATTAGLSHEHVPGSRARLMGVEVAINGHGFRDGEFSLAESEQANEYRVLLVGSSITMGWGVPYDKVFTRLVQAKLDADGARFDGRRITLHNAGIGNHNTRLQLLLLKDCVDDYRPHCIILHYFINDAEVVGPGSQSWLVKKSTLAALLYVRFKKAMAASAEGVSSLGDHYRNLYVDGSPGWTATRESILGMQALASERSARFGVLIQPELNDISPTSLQEQSYDVLRAFLAEHGIRYADLVSYFRDSGASPRQFWVQADDTHPNAAGHALMALGLADALREWNVVGEE